MHSDDDVADRGADDGDGCCQVLAARLPAGVRVYSAVDRALPGRDRRAVRLAGGRLRQASVDGRGAPARLLRHRRPARQDARDTRTLPRGGAQPRHRGHRYTAIRYTIRYELVYLRALQS